MCGIFSVAKKKAIKTQTKNKPIHNGAGGDRARRWQSAGPCLRAGRHGRVQDGDQKRPKLAFHSPTRIRQTPRRSFTCFFLLLISKAKLPFGRAGLAVFLFRQCGSAVVQNVRRSCGNTTILKGIARHRSSRSILVMPCSYPHPFATKNEGEHYAYACDL